MNIEGGWPRGSRLSLSTPFLPPSSWTRSWSPATQKIQLTIIQPCRSSRCSPSRRAAQRPAPETRRRFWIRHSLSHCLFRVYLAFRGIRGASGVRDKGSFLHSLFRILFESFFHFFSPTISCTPAETLTKAGTPVFDKTPILLVVVYLPLQKISHKSSFLASE